METQYFYLDNLHSILFLWGMSRPWEELSLEPFTALSVKKIEELGGKISIQRRVFFPPKLPWEGFPTLDVQSTGAAAGRLIHSDPELPFHGNFLLPWNEEPENSFQGRSNDNS